MVLKQYINLPHHTDREIKGQSIYYMSTWTLRGKVRTRSSLATRTLSSGRYRQKLRHVFADEAGVENFCCFFFSWALFFGFLAVVAGGEGSLCFHKKPLLFITFSQENL